MTEDAKADRFEVEHVAWKYPRGAVDQIRCGIGDKTLERDGYSICRSPTYSQLMPVAYGATPKQAGLDGHIIKSTKLQQIAVKVLPTRKA